MFLDPDPKRERNSSQNSLVTPHEPTATWRRRNQQPLGERSQSENNQQPSAIDPSKPTVRLVKASPGHSEDGEDAVFWNQKRSRHGTWQNREQSPAHGVIRASAGQKPGILHPTAPGQAFRVSEQATSANETNLPIRAPRDILLSSSISNSTLPVTSWLRRSGSSGNFSNTSTLQDVGSSIYGPKSLRTESRASQGTTLRGTPTPTEFEHRERLAADDEVRRISLRTPQTIDDTSPEVSTVRLVSSPPQIGSQGNFSPSGSSDTSVARPRSLSNPIEAVSPTSSAGSLPTSSNFEVFTSSPPPRHQQSQESLPRSDTSDPITSSPNIIAYSSDSARPRSRNHPLHAVASLESIQSRLHSSVIHRPDTARSVATNTSWASRPPSSDELPPLYIPRRRLRHKAGTNSLNAAAAATASATISEDTMDTMEPVEIDTQPYPRQAFSMHLSTIASESDPQSRSASQHLSHFSLGSGVLTIDDSSNYASSEAWPARENADVRSDVSSLGWNASSDENQSSSVDFYREGVAFPHPLFHARSPSAPLTNARYNAPLPPIPPIPGGRDSEEHFDTVPELASTQLREKRSGYSLRRRSQSTPSRDHSRQMSQASINSRWSQATNTNNLFPTWAKAYYGYGATLLSSSQISLSTPLEAQPIQKYLITRDWSERSRSFTSRISSEVSGGDSASPASSGIIPTIFRPHAQRVKRGIAKRISRGSRPSAVESDGRPDSMIITQAPRGVQSEDSALPSGHPRYGDLRDSSDQRRPLPRRYTKQRNWDRMDFPRRMSSDALGGAGSGGHGQSFDTGTTHPHLEPNRRFNQRLSAWHAPSFVESLDTLIRSRCNRQILLFVLGFLCPLFWMLAAVLPLPRRPMSETEFEKTHGLPGSQEDVQVAMMKHEAGDAETRRHEERQWLKARWWRCLNRVMSVIGLFIIAAVIALAVVATRM